MTETTEKPVILTKAQASLLFDLSLSFTHVAEDFQPALDLVAFKLATKRKAALDLIRVTITPLGRTHPAVTGA